MNEMWFDISATVVSGLIISFVFSYFQSDLLRSISDRMAARAYVWAKDHPFVSFYVPLLLLAASLLQLAGVLTRLSMEVAFLVWTASVLTLSLKHRRQPSLIAAFNASAPMQATIEMVDLEDGSTSVEEFDGHKVVCIGGNDPDRHYIYFRLPERLARGFRRSRFVVFAVEVGDDVTDMPEVNRLHFGVQFDRSEQAPFKTAYSQGLLGQRPWYIALCPAAGAEFKRRQQDQADFRVWVRRGLSLRVRNVYVIALHQ
jgi:hypothetical protein